MRTAAIATSIAAVVAIPMAVTAAGPQMSAPEFLNAVQCVAYENAAAPGADLAVEKLRLNAEAMRQPAAVAAAARRQAQSISAAFREGQAAPVAGCGASRIADEVSSARAV